MHISEGAKRVFERSHVEYAIVHTAQRELFAASLDYADTDDDRIKACDLAIEDARRAQGRH